MAGDSRRDRDVLVVCLSLLCSSGYAEEPNRCTVMVFYDGASERACCVYLCYDTVIS